MIKPKHVSASSSNVFTECRAKYAANYDQETKTYSRTIFTDKGLLLHETLEAFNSQDDRSKEQFYRCFDQAVIDAKLAETLPVYKSAYELLDQTWSMMVAHPTIPVQLVTTLANEYEMHYRPEGWALDLMGFVDRVFIITPEKQNDPDTTHIILGINDYKSGRPKQYSELVDDIQVGFNLLWARDVMAASLEEQGYTVDKIVAVWDYIAEGKSVSIWESDYDLDTFHRWMTAQTEQVVKFAEDYNKAKEDGIDVNVFLQDGKYETPNNFCGWCSRKNVCSAFQRALAQKELIDPTDGNWEDIIEERERFSSMSRYGDDQRKRYDGMIRAYMEEEKIGSIDLPESGREVYVQNSQNTEIPISVIRDLLGDGFVLEKAKFSSVAVKSEVARRFDSEKASEILASVEARSVKVPGSSSVKVRKVKTEAPAKRKKRV